MTHDELLARIDSKQQDYYADDQSLNALRAVVELHKPEGYGGPARCRVDGSHYPCSTIQAIEKELK
jgi:hypothetical protein